MANDILIRVKGDVAELRKSVRDAFKDIQFSISQRSLSAAENKIAKLAPTINAKINVDAKSLSKLSGTIGRIMQPVKVSVVPNLNSLSSFKASIQKFLSPLNLNIKTSGGNISGLSGSLNGLTRAFNRVGVAKDKFAANVAAKFPQMVANFILLSNASKILQQNLTNIGAVNLNNLNGLKGIPTKAISQVTNQTRSATRATQDFSDQVAITANRFAAYSIGATLLFKIGQGFDYATKRVFEIDKALNRLQQIFSDQPGSKQRASGLGSAVLGIAEQYGQSGADLLKIADTLAQAGNKFGADNQILLTVREIAKSNLAATFGDIEETTQGLIAVLNQFNLTAAEIPRIMDIANIASKDFAITSGDLFEAVKRGGAQYAAAGGGFEDFFASIVAIKGTTQLPASVVGTNFGNLTLKQLNKDVVQFANELTGGNLREADGTLKNIAENFKEIARALSGVDPEVRINAIQKFGDIRSGGKALEPLLKDLGLGEEQSSFYRSIKQFSEATGSLDKDAAIGLNRLSAILGSVTAKFDQLFKTFSEDEGIKKLVKDFADMTKSSAELLNILRPILPLLLKLGTIKLGLVGVEAARKLFTGTRAGDVGYGSSGFATSTQPGGIGGSGGGGNFFRRNFSSGGIPTNAAGTRQTTPTRVKNAAIFQFQKNIGEIEAELSGFNNELLNARAKYARTFEHLQRLNQSARAGKYKPHQVRAAQTYLNSRLKYLADDIDFATFKLEERNVERLSNIDALSRYRKASSPLRNFGRKIGRGAIAAAPYLGFFAADTISQKIEASKTDISELTEVDEISRQSRSNRNKNLLSKVIAGGSVGALLGFQVGGAYGAAVGGVGGAALSLLGGNDNEALDRFIQLAGRARNREDFAKFYGSAVGQTTVSSLSESYNRRILGKEGAFYNEEDRKKLNTDPLIQENFKKQVLGTYQKYIISSQGLLGTSRALEAALNTTLDDISKGLVGDDLIRAQASFTDLLEKVRLDLRDRAYDFDVSLYKASKALYNIASESENLVDNFSFGTNKIANVGLRQSVSNENFSRAINAGRGELGTFQVPQELGQRVIESITNNLKDTGLSSGVDFGDLDRLVPGFQAKDLLKADQGIREAINRIKQVVGSDFTKVSAGNISGAVAGTRDIGKFLSTGGGKDYFSENLKKLEELLSKDVSLLKNPEDLFNQVTGGKGKTLVSERVSATIGAQNAIFSNNQLLIEMRKLITTEQSRIDNEAFDFDLTRVQRRIGTLGLDENQSLTRLSRIAPPDTSDRFNAANEAVKNLRANLIPILRDEESSFQDKQRANLKLQQAENNLALEHANLARSIKFLEVNLNQLTAAVQKQIEGRKSSASASLSDYFSAQLGAGTIGQLSGGLFTGGALTGATDLKQLNLDQFLEVVKQTANLANNPIFLNAAGRTGPIDQTAKLGDTTLGSVKDILTTAAGFRGDINAAKEFFTLLQKQKDTELELGKKQQEIIDGLQTIFEGTTAAFNKNSDELLKLNKNLEGFINKPLIGQNQENGGVGKIEANINVVGFDNVGRDVAARAISIGVMKKFKESLGVVNTPSTRDVAQALDVAIKALEENGRG